MAVIKDKEKVKRKLISVFKHLKRKGINAEDFASQFCVSYQTVKAWKSGRRAPKIPTLRQIETQFGVKIL